VPSWLLWVCWAGPYETCPSDHVSAQIRLTSAPSNYSVPYIGELSQNGLGAHGRQYFLSPAILIQLSPLDMAWLREVYSYMFQWIGRLAVGV
jgi:hypothetical protein